MKNKKINYLVIGFLLLGIYSAVRVQNLKPVYSQLNRERVFKSPLSLETKKPPEAVAGHSIIKTGSVASAFKGLLGRILGIGDRRGRPQPLQKEVFGFLPFWTLEKRAFFRYELLSTIAYFGLDIEKSGNFIKLRDNGKTDGAWASWQSDELNDVIKEARKHRVDFLLTIKAFDNETTEKLLACPRCRANLINNALAEVKQKEVDGVNLDFEYVGTPDDDVIFRFTQLVNDFSETFHAQIPGSLVTVSTYAKSAVDKKIHAVASLAQVADYLFVMGYDFFRPVSTYAGPVSPLTGAEKYGYDLKTTVDDYLKLVPAEKIVLGLPYYGYDWPVENDKPNAKTLEGSDKNGYANMSSYVKSQYDPLNHDGSRRWDSLAQVPFYSWFDEERRVWRQCYYEDTRSLGLKYDLIKEKKLRGVGIWALGYDDDKPELWDLLEEKFTR